MTELVDLVTEPPTEGLYMLLHPAQRVSLFLSVQLAVVDSSVARYGSAHYGQDVYASSGGHWQWLDMTGLVRGASWTRGSIGLVDRPEVGTCELTLSWDGGFLDLVDNSIFPYPSALREGALWRIVVSTENLELYAPALPSAGGLEEAGGFEVLFTGVVESMQEHSTSQWADAWIDLTLAETASLASRHDDAAVPDRGAGDILQARLERVLGIAPPRARPWAFGLIGDPSGGMADFVTFQPTNLAQPMLEEVYRVVDTVHFDAYTDRTGALRVIDRALGFEWRTRPGGDDLAISLRPTAALAVDTVELPYDITDGFGFERNTDDVANVIIAAATGGTEQVVVDANSRKKNGQITTGRDDLLMEDTGGHVQEWAQRELEARKNLVLHAGPINLDAAMDPLMGEALAVLDLHTIVNLGVPNRTPVEFLVCGYTMSLLPLDDLGNTQWLAEVSLRPTVES